MGGEWGRKKNTQEGENYQQRLGESPAKVMRLELGGDHEIAVETELRDVSEKIVLLFFTDWETKA